MARPVAILGVALAIVLGASAPALGVESLPELTETERASIEGGLQAGASYGDPAFDTLLAHVRAWGQIMPRWAAVPDLAPPALSPAQITALTESPDATGAPVVIYAEFLERQPLPKYANVERWLVAPLDPDDPGVSADRAAIVFIDRTTSAAFDLPRPGSFVRIAGRYYKPLVLPRRTTGEEVAYPSFVGASFEARQSRGDPPSGLFVFVGIGVALMVAAFVVLFVVISRLRSKPSQFELARASGRLPPPPGDEPDLPPDPAEALKHLADRADSAEKDSHG